eukprot:jgi/Botrbrau1/15521/Bobra.0225s0010.1
MPCYVGLHARTARGSQQKPLHLSVAFRPLTSLRGDQLPDEHILLSLRYAAAGLQTWVQGLLATGPESAVVWVLLAPKEASGVLCQYSEQTVLKMLYATQKFLAAVIKPTSPAQVVPCLGLVHLACKHIAAAQSRKAGLRGWQLPPRALLRKVPPHGGAKEVSPWNSAGTVGVQDQRALSVLHMWNRRLFGSGIPDLSLVLSDSPVVRGRSMLQQCARYRIRVSGSSAIGGRLEERMDDG